jgi:Subtilase family
MAGAPSKFRMADGTVVRRDDTRLAAYLAQPGRAGDPVLTERSRAKLRSLGLAVEADPGPEGDVRQLFTINHGPRLIWLRTIRKLSKLPAADAVSRALGRRLSWLVPAYRLPNVEGLDALFCARPDVLLLQAMPGTEAAADALADRLRLRRNFDRCRFPGGWRYLEIPAMASANAFDLLARCQSMPNGPNADLDGIPLRSPFQSIPDDPFFSEQWYLDRIGAPQAWDIAICERRVVVAVVDSGCDLVHPDLVDAYVSPGRNAGDPTADGSPVIIAPAGRPSQHGTNVAGVIAAGRNNRMGIAGLAGGCGLFSVAMPEHSTSEFADGITYAVEAGAQVINLSTSIGEYWFSRARAMIDEAVARGVVFCASSGNYSDPRLIFPARYPPVMAIGGSDKTDGRWIRADVGLGSGYGDELYGGVPTGVSVIAPAVDIATTDLSGPEGYDTRPSPEGDYLHSLPPYDSIFGMTSASTPQVAAAAALLKSAYATLSGAEVRRVIERTAEKVGPYSYADVPGYPNGSRHNEVGYGRLNVFKALDLGDVMIADWPLDNGVEPSTPPGGDFFTRSDIVIGPSDDDTFDPTSDGSSDIREEMAHTISVRVRNVGPATARGVTVDVRATPWVGLEFVYPEDWVTEDGLHIPPAAIDPAPFTLANGETAIRRFGLTATQSTALAGWAPRFHPCLVAVTLAENDYAFAAAPSGASLQMRRNNLAQRNLSVMPIAELLSFPFVIGHPANLEPRVDLIVETGALAREGEVFLLLGDASEAFPAAKRAQAFGKGQVKAGSIAGGKLTKLDGRPAVRINGVRAVIELIRPSKGRHALQLAIRAPAHPAARYVVRLFQRVQGRGVTGGATVVFRRE